MDFFEALEKRAMEIIDKIEAKHGNPPYDPATDAISGIDAMTEALKEMMVGEPIAMCLEHEDMGPKTSTFLVDMNDELHARWDGYKGTDGEEVVVMVFRLS